MTNEELGAFSEPQLRLPTLALGYDPCWKPSAKCTRLQNDSVAHARAGTRAEIC